MIYTILSNTNIHQSIKNTSEYGHLSKLVIWIMNIQSFIIIGTIISDTIFTSIVRVQFVFITVGKKGVNKK